MTQRGPSGSGRYRILSPSASWKAEFGHVRKQAIIRDLQELGARGHWGDHVDIFLPEDGRDVEPAMSADVGEGEVVVYWRGRDDDPLWRRLLDLVETWRKRYSEPELRIVAE